MATHTSTNGPFTTEQFDEMVRALKDMHRVAFVHVKAPRAWDQHNNVVIAEGVRRYAKKAVPGARPEIFVDDQVYLLHPRGSA